MEYHHLFVHLAAAVGLLCAIPGVLGDKKLKCVQCGTSYDLDSLAASVANAIDGKQVSVNYCPKELPPPTPCASSDQKYCVKTEMKKGSTRFCSNVQQDKCKHKMCFRSCTTDGCNGAPRATSSRWILLVLAAVVGSLWMRW